MFRFVALYLMVASSYCACIKFPDSDQFDAFINQIESELDGDNDNEDEKRNCVLNDLDAARTALEVVKKARERGDLDKGKFKAVIDDFYKKLAALEKSYKAIRRNR
ncbi:MAG: hypothetical protein LBL32_02495, partial [Holosporales bacterium]|nr:hypothetical protein [Holosporales bacterium]